MSKADFTEKYFNGMVIKEYFAFEIISYVWSDIHKIS
jgi:hypothetical protein